MATLAADKTRSYNLTGDQVFNELPAIASDIIYAGSAVGESTTSGTYRPLNGADNFGGFCIEKCDNSAGSANDKQIKVIQRGFIWLTVTGADNVNDADSTVYASDDDTFTLTSTTTVTDIGRMVRYDSGRAKALVFFEADSVRSL